MSQVKTSITKLLYLFVCIAMVGTMIPPAGVQASTPADALDDLDIVSSTLFPDNTQSVEESDVLSRAALQVPTGISNTIYLPVVMRNYTPPAPLEMLIEPGIGGEIGSPDGKVRVNFAPEAVTQTVRARYTPLTVTVPLTMNLAAGGAAFEISATTLDGAPVGEFAPLVTIITDVNPAVTIVTPTVRISVTYSAEDVWGLDMRTLFLYTYDTDAEEWIAAPSATDQEQGVLTAEIDRLGTFVPMARLAIDAPYVALTGSGISTQGLHQTMTGTTMLLAIDPDDDLGHAYWPGHGTVREIHYNWKLAQEVKQRFEDDECRVDILITRNSESQRSVSRNTRASAARNFGAEVFVTFAFNALTGSPWGYSGDGGTLVWHGGSSDDRALGEELRDGMSGLGRPRRWGRGHPALPYDEFVRLSADYAHIETLYLDHNYDWPWISESFSSIADAVYTGLATRLGDMGLLCDSGDTPHPPTLPAPPSPELIKRMRDLGYQNYQRYGADPVSFSTGNHVVQTHLTRIPGRGGLDWALTLTYNSQDRRDDLFGYGWTFPYNARAQEYIDGSVDIVLADGRTYHYIKSGSNYAPPSGVHARLEKTSEGWQWITKNETTLTFQWTEGGLGILTEWRDRQGNALHFTYDLSGQDAWMEWNPVPRPPLTEIRDDAGRTIAVQSDDNSHTTRLSLWDGRNYNFTYNDKGDLTRISGPAGQIRRYEYDSRHRMTKEWDPDDFLFLQSVYDDRDRVVEQIDASGSHGYLNYNAGARATTFTDNLSNEEIYHWDELNRVTGEQDGIGAEIVNEYDPDYNVTSRTDAEGHTTRYEYDDRGNVTARYDPIPAGVNYTNDVTHWTYDEYNQPTSRTNALGNTWQYEYDAQGNLIRAVNPDGSETRAAYNVWGQPTTITDAKGRVTGYEYDEYGNLTRTTYADGSFPTSTYDAAGRETSYTDANGHTVEFEYDNRDNITRIVDPKGAESLFEYDGNDLLTRSVDRREGVRLYQYDENLKLTGERDQEGNWTHYEYNAMYQRVAMTDAEGRITRYEYDAAGQLIAITDPAGEVTRYEHDDNGNVVATIDPLGRRTRMIYDAVNRLKYLIDAAGRRTEYCYDAEDRLVRTIGPRGEVTDYDYDAQDRLIYVKDPLGYVTRYAHDEVGNRVALTDTMGYVTDYQYNDLDQLIAVRRPELPDGQRPTTRYAHDAVGNTLVITSPRGFATTFDYDRNDNPLTITDPMGGQTTYTYDAEDSPLTVTDPNGHTVTTIYNLAGVPVQTVDAMGYTTTLEYNDVYDVIATTNALNQTTTYDYDARGDLAQTTDPLGNETAYTRDAASQVVAVTDANGHATAYGYNEVGELITVTDALSGTTQYGRDAVGNLTVITDANGSVTTFEHNFLNQLIRETNPLSNTWEYAYYPNGQLKRKVDAMWRATYYDYDNNGRLMEISYGSTPPTMAPITFTYDLEGHETQMCDGLGCTAHTYDPLGGVPARPTGWGARSRAATTRGAT